MANRSYLIAADCVPMTTSAGNRGKPVGISEFSYDIPIVFKVLLSGRPETCRSLIWDSPDEIAIAGDYKQGVAALMKFLDRIERPEVDPLKREAQEFLALESNRRQHFILECNEIFEMDDGSIPERNAALLREIENLEASIESALSSLAKAQQPKLPTMTSKFFSWLRGSKPSALKDPLEPYYHLGLGFWDNTLFYSPEGAEE